MEIINGLGNYNEKAYRRLLDLFGEDGPQGPTAIGLDLSTASSGVCIVSGGIIVTTETIKPKSKDLDGKIDEIAKSVKYLCASYVPSLIAIESVIIGRNTKGSLSLASLGGAVRYALRKEGWQYVDVNPTSLKRFATGKGNANKAAIIEAVKTTYGYEGKDNNEADAVVLAMMAYDGIL